MPDTSLQNYKSIKENKLAIINAEILEINSSNTAYVDKKIAGIDSFLASHYLGDSMRSHLEKLKTTMSDTKKYTDARLAILTAAKKAVEDSIVSISAKLGVDNG